MTVKICTEHENKPKKKDPDFLRADLEQAIQGDLCFTFYVQLQVDPKKTPIENAAVRWDPKVSPELPVADVHLRKQDFANDERDVFCDSLSFNPWHGISAHQPMGHINRARRHVYDASRNHRGGSVEPKLLMVEEEAVPAAETQEAPAETESPPSDAQRAPQQA